MEGSCQTCKFFMQIGTTGPAARKECRRMPPIPMLMRGAGGTATVATFFPTVKADLVCGEFKPGITLN